MEFILCFQVLNFPEKSDTAPEDSEEEDQREEQESGGQTSLLRRLLSQESHRSSEWEI